MKSPYAQSDALCLKQYACCISLDEASRVIDIIAKVDYMAKSSLHKNDWMNQEMETIRNIALNFHGSLNSLAKNVHRIFDNETNKDSLIHTLTNILNRLVELRNRLHRVIDHVKEIGDNEKIVTELTNLLSSVNSIAIKLVIISLSFSTKIKWSKESVGPFSAAIASSILATLLDIDQQVAKAIDECLHAA